MSMNNGRSFKIKRGDTLRHEFYPYFDGTGVIDVWFTVKDQKSCDDSKALLQVSLLSDLIVINKTPATVAANGFLSLASDGRCTVVVDEVETAKLPTGLVWYDVQLLRNPDVIETIYLSKCHIVGDVTRVTS